jgi:hypothetical protein
MVTAGDTHLGEEDFGAMIGEFESVFFFICFLLFIAYLNAIRSRAATSAYRL